MLNHSCILCLDWTRSHPFSPMESHGAAPLTLAERVTASINAPGSLTNYSWDSSENLCSWGLNEVVLRFDRAYRGNLLLLRMCPLTKKISACLQDWDFVSTVVDDLVSLEEECRAELSIADNGVTPSGVSLRQMTILLSGIRAELRLDIAWLNCNSIPCSKGHDEVTAGPSCRIVSACIGKTGMVLNKFTVIAPLVGFYPGLYRV